MAKAHQEGVTVIHKFLNKLGSTAVQRSSKKGCDLNFTFGKQRRIGSIKVCVGNQRTGTVFAETYTTRLPANSDGKQIGQRPGYLYAGQADFMFFLNGTLLYIVPLRSFRDWADKNATSFRSGLETYWHNGVEIRRHGLVIPAERICKDFAKGNSHVSVYRLKDNPNSKTEIDFYQEI